jgi:hypothetical protein
MKHTMNTLTIEITNPKAMNLLEDLADLQLIRFIDKVPTTPKPKLSSLLRGSISAQTAEEFNQSVQQAKEGWERPI